MNYIENKLKFREEYSNIDIDEILNNYLTKGYNTIDYKEYLVGMKYYSKDEILKLCDDFFEDKFKVASFDVKKILKFQYVKFIEEENIPMDNSIIDGKTTYNNGVIECSVILKNNLYDLFILVHELTHYLSMLKPRREEFAYEASVFSEVFPFRMEEELIKYLKEKGIDNDLDKCIKARETILKNMVKHVITVKDNLTENIDFEFRYIISILYKNKLKVSLEKGIYSIGNLSIKEVIDFSI